MEVHLGFRSGQSFALPLLISMVHSARQEEPELQAVRMWELLKQCEGSQASFQRFWKRNGAVNGAWKHRYTKVGTGPRHTWACPSALVIPLLPAILISVSEGIHCTPSALL